MGKGTTNDRQAAMEANEGHTDLKRVGLKVTHPRLRILHVLEHSEKRHLTAEDVYRQLLEQGEDAGLTTIYRVLTQFEAAGLVVRHNFGEGRSVFELDKGEHHDHLLCVVCGRVEEFVDEVIERRQREVAAEKGYEMTDHYLHIYGICKACRDDSKIDD